MGAQRASRAADADSQHWVAESLLSEPEITAGHRSCPAGWPELGPAGYFPGAQGKMGDEGVWLCGLPRLSRSPNGHPNFQQLWCFII